MRTVRQLWGCAYTIVALMSTPGGRSPKDIPIFFWGTRGLYTPCTGSHKSREAKSTHTFFLQSKKFPLQKYAVYNAPYYNRALQKFSPQKM